MDSQEKRPSHREKPYNPAESEPTWRTAVEAWQWTALDEYTSRKVGECPRCGHTMTVDARGGTMTSALPQTARRRVLARCNCGADHEGHPERTQNDWGCGFRTSVVAP
jgi:hypothetical protein